MSNINAILDYLRVHVRFLSAMFAMCLLMILIAIVTNNLKTLQSPERLW